VDVHTHLAPRLAEDDAALPGPPSLRRPEALAAWLVDRGVDQAWVSIPPPFYRQGQDHAATADWARAVNDGLARRIEGLPSLRRLGYLSLDVPSVAVAELERLLDSSDVVGFTGAAGGGSRPLDGKDLAAVWDLLEVGNRPMLLHPGSSADPRLDRFYLNNLLGNPVETTVAAAELVLGDVLGSRPALRVALVHCGGAVPALAGRWQQGVETDRPGIEPLTVDPLQAVRRLWTDALGHSAAVVDLARAVLGEDRLVLGSDWPFPMGLADPWSAIRHLDPQQQRRVARHNASTLAGR